MLASAAILASVVVRHNDILVRRDLRVRKKRVVGRHFAHRAPQCISSFPSFAEYFGPVSRIPAVDGHCIKQTPKSSSSPDPFAWCHLQ